MYALFVHVPLRKFLGRLLTKMILKIVLSMIYEGFFYFRNQVYALSFAAFYHIRYACY